MKGLDLSAPFRQLAERRLWPVALLLLAALAAVPVLLSKSSSPAPTSSTAPAPATTANAATEPVVQLADAARTDRRRSVLGARKDPFRPGLAPRAEKAAQEVPPPPAPSPGPTTGGTAPTTSTPPTVLTPPTAPKKRYELYSLIVRFGDSATPRLPKANLKRLKGMPTVEDPVVIYLGLKRDRRTAVFLVDAKAVVQGDGVCQPHPNDCQTLELKVGETAFFDVTSEAGQVSQYQLDIVRVIKKRTADAKAAKRSRYSTARGGRDALRARMGRVNGYRYDARTGTVDHSSRGE